MVPVGFWDPSGIFWDSVVLVESQWDFLGSQWDVVIFWDPSRIQ